jgi:transposase-like protein
MSEPSKKRKARGQRYNAEEKSKVVAFVNEYNSTNGRGGQSAASVKYGVSPLTIMSWLKGKGTKVSVKSSKKGNLQGTLNSLLTLGKEIDKMEAELKVKRAKFDALKATL